MLDERVNGCAANHPALSDMTGYLGDKAGGYPHHFRKDRNEATAAKIRTLEYYDVVNFCPPPHLSRAHDLGLQRQYLSTHYLL